MKEQELKLEALIQRHLDKFNDGDPACHICDENHPLCLRPQNFDSIPQIYCWNCWTIAQEAKLDLALQEKRHIQKIEELQPHLPICLSCGETTVCVLEQHHWLQARYRDQTQINCENCHRLFNALQYAHHPPVPRGEIGSVAYIAKVFLALADEAQLRAARRQKLIGKLVQNFNQSWHINEKGA
jgi:hypothetical protein